MYHVARHYNKLSTRQPWQWYLERAAKTALRFSCNTGVMDGTVFREVLRALKVEGVANATIEGWAAALDVRMQGRQKRWASQRFPYGSEFAFDTTGQEEVVVWNMWYGDQLAAKATVDHILSYMRSNPTWAYNGGARAADSGNNGKWYVASGSGKPDRGQMHYRSGLNMIPLLEWYRQHPEKSFFLLEVAMGAISGQMTNIDKRGATSMFYHSYPWIMDFDPHSGDYGLGFFGNALEAGAYYVEHPRLGPLCFLCSATLKQASNNNSTGAVVTGKSSVVISPQDAYRRRVFVAPLRLYLAASAGTIDSVTVDQRKVTVLFNATEFGERPWSKLRLLVETTSGSMSVAMANATTNCTASYQGKPLPPVATVGGKTFALAPAAGAAGTELLLTC